MKFTKTLIAATAIAFAGSAATAGGLADTIDTGPVVIPTTTSGPSLNSGYIVLGVLAALVAVAASESSSGS